MWWAGAGSCSVRGGSTGGHYQHHESQRPATRYRPEADWPGNVEGQRIHEIWGRGVMRIGDPGRWKQRESSTESD